MDPSEDFVLNPYIKVKTCLGKSWQIDNDWDARISFQLSGWPSNEGAKKEKHKNSKWTSFDEDY